MVPLYVVAYVDDLLVAGVSIEVDLFLEEMNKVMTLKCGKDFHGQELVRLVGSHYLREKQSLLT